MWMPNLKAALLCVLIAIGFAAQARALSVLPTYDAAHYDGTSWVIVEIDGQKIDPLTAPWLAFSDDTVFVNQGCHSFRIINDVHRDIKIRMIQTLVACDEITPQQARIIDIFRAHIGYVPNNTDIIEGLRVVRSNGPTLLRAEKIPDEEACAEGL